MLTNSTQPDPATTPPDADPKASGCTLTLVDDAFVWGGGQMGLARYTQVPSDYERRLILLSPLQRSRFAGNADVPVHTAQSHSLRLGLPLAWLRLLPRFAAQARRPELVVANSLKAAIVVALLPKRRRVFIYYLREDLSPQWIGGFKRMVLERLLLPRFDGFLANSKWTASTLPPRLRARPVRVAFPLCGVPAAARHVMTARQPATERPAVKLLSLSRIAHWKGIDVAIDAASMLARTLTTPVVLTLAGSVAPGDEDYAAALRARPAVDNLTLAFAGHVADVDALLDEHDVLLVCSRHPEPFGQVVIQGLASGLGLVATRQGGPAEVLTDEPTARLVPPDDVPATFEALQDLATQVPSATERADASHRAVTRFSDERLAAEFDEALAALSEQVRQRRAGRRTRRRG